MFADRIDAAERLAGAIDETGWAYVAPYAGAAGATPGYLDEGVAALPRAPGRAEAEGEARHAR